MVLDFITSRSMMIVGGLLMAGAAAGTYSFVVGIPQQAGAQAFANAWAQPFIDAAVGTGDAGTVVTFGRDFARNVLPTSYRGKAVDATVYRDALVLRLDAKDYRVPFLAAARTHVWHATNADTYVGEDQAFLDRMFSSIPLDLSRPVSVVRAANATGVTQVYVSQIGWDVDPPVCALAFSADRTQASDRRDEANWDRADCASISLRIVRPGPTQEGESLQRWVILGGDIASSGAVTDAQGTMTLDTASAEVGMKAVAEGAKRGRVTFVVEGETAVILPVLVTYPE